MTLDEYQQAALTTAIYPGKGKLLGLTYATLKLAGESGEVAEHLGKAFRDDGFGITQPELTPERHSTLKKELGDVLWYVAAAARELGLDLSEVAAANISKLASRAERGQLQGSGDDR
jgi:NTP pyrophosphatase (non-canonical NTP hydrolase)